MKKYDCGLIGNDLYVARDPGHHYIIKFTLKCGEWRFGHKRGEIWTRGYPVKLEMTFGYYEKPVRLFNRKIREDYLIELIKNGKT